MSKRYKYKFSVIMPIYNVESYLSEAIDSVIMQTIGFEDHIQLILVNDGSSDGCGDICNEYKCKYPENIIYIEQENKGVSYARNAGIPYIQGKYVNFFDSDDKWSPDAFEKVWNFFMQHGDEIDVACCRSLYFEAMQGEHNLNNKFKNGDRVVDIRETPRFILLNVTTAFISEDVVKTERFDERLSIGEDSKYITKTILNKEKYGAVGSAIYNIRKRQAKSSITQNYNISRYNETIEYYYKYMLDYSMERYSELLPYIQHVVLNGLKYRVLETPKSFMTTYQWQEYTDRVIDIIRRIDDSVIATTNNIHVLTKIYLLKLKYGGGAEREVYIEKNAIWFRGVKLANVTKKYISIDEVTLSWRKASINGTVRIPMNDNIKLYIKEGRKYRQVETIADEQLTRESFIGEMISRGQRFSVTMKKSDADMTFYLGKAADYVKITPDN